MKITRELAFETEFRNTNEGFTYDNLGRIKYHPEFHENHGKPFTEEELCYLCKFYGFDGRRSVSFALGRPEGPVQKKYLQLRKKQKILYYKILDHYC